MLLDFARLVFEKKLKSKALQKEESRGSTAGTGEKRRFSAGTKGRHWFSVGTGKKLRLSAGTKSKLKRSAGTEGRQWFSAGTGGRHWFSAGTKGRQRFSAGDKRKAAVQRRDRGQAAKRGGGMRALKKYILVYREFFNTSLSMEMSFRLNFFLQNLMNLIFLGTSFFAAGFIFDHIESIGFWGRTEFFFFLSFFFAVDQIHYLLFSANFWGFSDDVRLGGLDFHLLKPVSSLFAVFARTIAVPGIVTAAGSSILLVYFGWKAGLGLFAWLSLPFCLLTALALLLGLEILISLLNFVTVEGMGVNQLRLQMQHFCRWPDFIYKNPLRLWMLPFLAVTSIPARYMLDPGYWSWMLLMFLGTAALWAFVLLAWPRASAALYESPSS